MITNESSDFTVGNNGMSIEASEAVVAHRFFGIHEDESFYGGLWGRTLDSAVMLQAQHNANLQVISVGSGDVTVRAVTGSVTMSTNNGPIIIEPGIGNNLQFRNLPTSSPGGSNRIWKDSNGFLRIT